MGTKLVHGCFILGLVGGWDRGDASDDGDADVYPGDCWSWIIVEDG